MRVLFISSLYPPYFLGGYELACSEVVRGLINRGHEALVLTGFSHLPGAPDPEYIDRCLELRAFEPYPVSVSLNEYEMFEASCSNLQNTCEVRMAIRRFEPDVVYCWHLYGIGGLAILDLLMMLGVPWVFHLMDNVPGLLISPTSPKVREIFTRAGYDIFRDARVISMSEHLLSEVRETIGITFRRDVEIIPGWVASEGFPLRTTYQSAGRTRFVTAGAIEAHKGIDLILQAAAHLVRQGFANFDIDFYGSGNTDHYLALAIGLGLLSHVRFLGGRNKMEPLRQYQNYDVFLFPTWEREPFGIAPIEAAACGCVPIVTSTCGVAERLVADVHCLKIERTVEALSEVMRAILCKEVDLPRIGQVGAALVRSDLAFESCLDRIEKVLEAEKRNWERHVLNDIKLPLLIHTKHHLARYLSFSCR
jgi:glycogen synthase